jgi:hypothetical protein
MVIFDPGRGSGEAVPTTLHSGDFRSGQGVIFDPGRVSKAAVPTTVYNGDFRPGHGGQGEQFRRSSTVVIFDSVRG